MSRTGNANEKDKNDENMARVLSRLEYAISRNTEVLNSAVETMGSLAKPRSKTPTPDEQSEATKKKRDDRVNQLLLICVQRE